MPSFCGGDPYRSFASLRRAGAFLASSRMPRGVLVSPTSLPTSIGFALTGCSSLHVPPTLPADPRPQPWLHLAREAGSHQRQEPSRRTTWPSLRMNRLQLRGHPTQKGHR